MAEGEAPVPPNPLTQAAACERLSDVGFTLDGSGLALLALDVHGMGLTDVAPGLTLPNVRYAVFDGNPLIALRAAHLAGFKSLMTASFVSCGLTQLDDLTEVAPRLHHLDLSRNDLVSLCSTVPPRPPAHARSSEDGDEGEEAAAPGADAPPAAPGGVDFVFAAPALRVLLLNHNKLTTWQGLHGPSFQSLVRLELAGNGLTSLPGVGEEGAGCPSLLDLILCHNQLTTLDGIAQFPRLRVLDVDGNAITSLSGLTDVVAAWGSESEGGDGDDDARPLAHLRVLSLKANALAEDSWASLSGLAPLQRLRELRIGGTPLAESPYRPRRLDLTSIGDGSLDGPTHDDLLDSLGIPDIGPLDTKLEVLLRLPQLHSIDDEPITPGDRRIAAEEGDKRAAVEAAVDKAMAEAQKRADAAAAAAAEAAAEAEGEDEAGGGDDE